MILYHLTTRSNLNSILKRGLLPQVGERSVELNEDPGVFLFPDLETLEEALGNWLGEQFDEDEALVTLEVNLPDDFPLSSSVEYERVSRVRIPPEYVKFLRDEE